MVIESWIFFEFVSDAGEAQFSLWLHAQPEEAQAAIDTRIVMMMRLSKQQWSSKWIQPYKGYDKLLELRITQNKIQYRPLGCFGPDRQEFTILAGAKEKNWKIPKPTLATAMSRMQLVLSDRRWIREYQFDPVESVEKASE